MSNKRENEAGAKTWYRSDRFMENNGAWYFVTREGTTEGPFDSKIDAEEMLERYVKVHRSGMLNEDTLSTLEMLPKGD